MDSDDDMEVTGYELEREELRRFAFPCRCSSRVVLIARYNSARIARREDAMAEAEEKRHEEEKKRRKAERTTRK